MIAKDINNLLFNPNWTGKLLHYFISGAYESKNGRLKFELIYLALPFLYDNIILEKLNNSNKNSSLSSLFKTPDLKNRLILMNPRIEAFRSITNKGLILLGNKIELTINSFIQINKKIHYNDEEISQLKIYSKGAFSLGQIIAKEEYKNIFVKLEIVNI